MRKIIAGIRVALAGVLAAAPSGAAVLENPGSGRLYSGIGVISGWKCEAGELTVRFNGGGPVPLLYGAERKDVLQAGACDQANVGFVTIWNWGNLGDGDHTAIAYDNGEEFDRTTFTVGSTGVEFLQGVSRQGLLENFPAPGETTVLEWNESSQHFEIRYVWGSALVGVYDQAYWRQMSIDVSEETYRTVEFLYAEEPDVDTCRAGELTQAAKDRALEAMNQIRALHGLEPVHYSSHYDNQVQDAALIGKANVTSGHFPEPSAQCYTEAGAVGSGSSNLSVTGRDIDPGWDMILYARDAGVRGVGHRRWLLNPFAIYMSYGQVYGATAQKVFGFDDAPPRPPQVEVEYVAFPYETYPFHLVEGDPPWSFSVIEDKRNIWGNQHPYFENAAVSVTRVSDGASLVITDRYTDTEGFGVPNLLSWQVEGWEFDTLYEVEISNVTLQNGVVRSYSYPVFIDRDNIEY